VWARSGGGDGGAADAATGGHAGGAQHERGASAAAAGAVKASQRSAGSGEVPTLLAVGACLAVHAGAECGRCGRCVCVGAAARALVFNAQDELRLQLFRGITNCLWQRSEHVYARSTLNLVSSSCVG